MHFGTNGRKGKNRKPILFGGLGSGISNIKESEEWQRVIDAVNHVHSEQHGLISKGHRTTLDLHRRWKDGTGSRFPTRWPRQRGDFVKDCAVYRK